MFDIADPGVDPIAGEITPERFAGRRAWRSASTAWRPTSTWTA